MNINDEIRQQYINMSSNPIFQDISRSIVQILRGVGCKSKAYIVEELISHIDGSELQECREYVFKVAIGIYDEKLESVNITGGRAKLELKQRRGESVDEKSASDITELVIYVCGLSKYFPPDVLSSRSTYVEIEPKEPLDNKQINV